MKLGCEGGQYSSKSAYAVAACGQYAAAQKQPSVQSPQLQQALLMVSKVDCSVKRTALSAG